VCILTGGNAGLGLALTKELLKRGYHVIISTHLATIRFDLIRCT